MLRIKYYLILAKSVKVDGFRQGNAPLEVVEKNVNQQAFQSEALNHLINDLYSESLTEKSLIPVGQPKITILKFVPFTTAEFKIEVEVIGNLKIGDYKQIKIKLATNPVSDSQLTETLETLRKRAATYTKVSRPAKKDDRLTIDFEGSDSKSKDKLDSASSKDFFLTLGSKTFIPGFEEKLIGKKEGQELSFDLTFPKDYFDKDFASRIVTFKVKVKVVEEAKLNKLDDTFAAKVGPFKNVGELKSQLKNELQRENDKLARQKQDSQILEKLASSTKCDIPQLVIDEEVEAIKRYDQQTALNNSLTWKEFLKSQNLTDEQYQKKVVPAASDRIKSSLAIIEIAKIEDIKVSKEEINQQIDLLKQQYSDPKMQAELETEAIKNDLTKRLITQKALDLIKNLN
jgi:trigger factor